MATQALPYSSSPLPPRISIDPVLHDYRSAMVLVAQAEGFTVHLDEDMEEFVRYLRNAPNNDGANPAFDPSATDMEDAFWVRVERNGKIVGVMGERFLDCSKIGYYDFIRSGQLFGRLSDGPLELTIDKPGPQGRICFGGGVYVHPEVRKTGLSWFLANLGRAIAIQIWNLHAPFGMVFDPLYRNGVAEGNYGSHRIVKLTEGYFAPKGEDAVVWSLEYDIPVLIEGMRHTILQVANAGYEQMRDLAPDARSQRKN
ncbi:MAG: hypothetical protein RLO01_12805 [Thalassobaculaceae bacterium]